MKVCAATLAVGFTGTRQGMTDAQSSALLRFLAEETTELHHGDCVGADAEAHKIAEMLGITTVGHPPSDSTYRAKCIFNVIREPKSYLVRNKNIVNDTQVTVATPAEFTEQRRGGTWSTVRYSIKKGHPTYVILPDGAVRLWGPK